MSELQMTRLQVGGANQALRRNHCCTEERNRRHQRNQLDIKRNGESVSFNKYLFGGNREFKFSCENGKYKYFLKTGNRHGSFNYRRVGPQSRKCREVCGIEHNKKYLLSNFRLSALQHWWMEHGCQRAAVLLSGKLQFDSRPIQHYHSSLQNCLNLNSKEVSLL